MPPEQGTKDQMFLGLLIASQHKPKVGRFMYCFDRVVLGQDNPVKTVHKTPTLGLSCEVIEGLRNIWYFVPCSGCLSLQLLLVTNINMRQFFLCIIPYSFTRYSTRYMLLLFSVKALSLCNILCQYMTICQVP